MHTMQKNINYDTITAGGNVHIGDTIYVVERDFQSSILFLRIDKGASGYEAMLTVKTHDDTTLQLFRGTVQLGISDELFGYTDDFQQVRRSSDQTLRRGLDTGSHSPETSETDLTEAIYQTFFPEDSDIGTVCRDFLDLLQRGKISELLLVISSADERIQNLPWEMVLPKLTVGRSDDLPKDNFGLIRSREETLESFKRQGPIAQQAPLKMLFIPALPENLPEHSKLLEIENEQRKIIEAVRGLETMGDQQPKLVMEILDSADLSEIEKALEARSHDIVHISGHGAYVENVKKGILYLENENGDQQETTGYELGTALHRFKSIKLLVLSACETAVGGPEGSTAEQMAAVGLPAVLAMRFSVTDAGARLFTEKLYQRLAYGDSLTKAVHDARQDLWAYVKKRRADAPQLSTRAEWFTPVLYQNQFIGSLVKSGEYNTETFNRFYPRVTFIKGTYTRLIGEGFIGRKRLLIQLRQCFRQGQHVCLHGLGGLGKTTTAEAFADHYRRQNGHDVLIFRKDTEINEAVMLERIFEEWKDETKPKDSVARQLKAQLDSPETTPERKLQLVINNCLNGRRTILILDNFEDVQTTTGDTQQQAIVSESLRAFICHLLQNAPPDCHILFTTRYRIADLDALVNHLAVDKMTYAEQYRYINLSDTLRRIPIAEQEILNRRLDGHPRALQFLEGLIRNDREFNLAQFDASIGQVESQIFDNLLLARVTSRLTETERDVFTVSSVFSGRSPLAALCGVSERQADELIPILASLRNWSICFWDQNEKVFEIHALTRAWMRKQDQPNSERFKVLSYQVGVFFREKRTVGDQFLAKGYFEQAEAWEEYASVSSYLSEHYELVGLYSLAHDLSQETLNKNISSRANANSGGGLTEFTAEEKLVDK